LNVATPDNYVRSWQSFVYIITLKENSGEFTPLFEQSKPIVIHRSSWLNLLTPRF
jgi:hypothetical protein